jgi:acetyl esterase/lipase
MSVERIHQRASLWSALGVWPLIRLLTALGSRKITSDGLPQRFPTKVPAGYEDTCKVRLTKIDFGIQAKELSGWKVSCVEARQSTKATRTIMYLHGGAFTYGITPQHWKICARLATSLNARVLVVPYPLLPATINTVLDPLLLLYEKIHQEAKDTGHEVIIAGDSAGGGLAVSLAFALLDRSMPCPDQLCLIAPSLDWSNSVPSVAEYARYDPWLKPALSNRLESNGHRETSSHPTARHSLAIQHVSQKQTSKSHSA